MVAGAEPAGGGSGESGSGLGAPGGLLGDQRGWLNGPDSDDGRQSGDGNSSWLCQFEV